MIAPDDYIHIFKNDPNSPAAATPPGEPASDKFQPLPTAMIAPGDYQHIFHKPGEGSQIKTNKQHQKPEASRRASKRNTGTPTKATDSDSADVYSDDSSES